LPIEVQDERRIPRGGLRAQEKSQRRAIIRQIIEENGMHSVREFVQKLEARNIKASAATIHRDLIALGYQENDTRKKAGRPNTQPALFTE
jgi:DeoR/GlpR family transcriptional regulator of sugar metabolism